MKVVLTLREFEQIKQTFRENEKIIKKEIETQYKTQIINLKRINEEQEKANNMQENTINQYKEQLEEATKTTHKNNCETGRMTKEILNLKGMEVTYIKTIQELQRKLQSKEDMEKHYRKTIEDKLLNELAEARDKILQ